MSRGPDETGANPPRRPRKPATPQGDPDALPPRAPIGDGGGSTFRPAPQRPAAGSRSRTGTGGRSRGGDDDAFVGTKETLAAGPRLLERILFGKVSAGQLAQFCRQLASYLNAGVDYSKTFSSMETMFSRSALGPAMGRIRVAIKSGYTLEEAMAREPQIFSPMFLSMIRVAEARGGVPETLRMMGDHYEARQRLIRQARSALIYPVIVLILAGAVVALISTLVLPMFAELLRDISRKAQLPWASRALMGFSSFVGLLGWWLLPLITIGVPFLILRLYRTASGKAVMDRLILMIPVFGPLCRKLDTSRFARTLATLMDAGVDMGSSIDLTSGVLTMTPLRQAVIDSRQSVLQGKELSEALAESRQFTPDVIAVLQSGEETGKLPETLNHLADDYEEQVQHMVKNMGTLVQPLLTLMLGAIVLFVILAVLLPYIQALSSLAAPGGGGP
ncbi:MAG: type II secretion system F family protein [Isosphaeraceae bacterium]